MTKKILTIIVPTFNMEKYLRNCLTSLIIDEVQYMEKLEVLVINDGSKDSSSKIAHSYQERFPNTFIVVDKENGNYGSCINRGLKEATGKYIKVLDADDWFNTNGLIKLINHLQTTDVDLILSDYAMISNKNENCKIEKYTPIDSISSLTKDYPYIQMHGVTYRTDILRKINYKQIEGISYTDMEWTFTPMIAVNSISYLAQVVYMYRLGRDGQTVDPIVYEKGFWQDIKVTKTIVQRFKENENSIDKVHYDYLLFRATSRVNNLYHNYFKVFKTKLNHHIMVEFDKQLNDIAPEIYNVFDSYTWGYGLLKNYHYIKHWRQFYFFRPPILLIVSSISKLLKHK